MSITHPVRPSESKNLKHRGPFDCTQGKHGGTQGGPTKLLDEHAISIRIKSVAPRNCRLVGRQDIFASTESAYQHQQCGLRQMEIGQHRFDGFKFETWLKS